MDREAWPAADGVAKSWTQLSDWTELKDTSIKSILWKMLMRDEKSDCKHIWELKTDLLIVSMPLLFAGLWSFLCSERINLLDTFVSVLECFEQGGPIDQFSPYASFYHHLCQVYWFGWQRTSLRWLMNKPMRIFNNRKTCGLGKILTTESITKTSTWEIFGHTVALDYSWCNSS